MLVGVRVGALGLWFVSYLYNSGKFCVKPLFDSGGAEGPLQVVSALEQRRAEHRPALHGRCLNIFHIPNHCCYRTSHLKLGDAASGRLRALFL